MSELEQFKNKIRCITSVLHKWISDIGFDELIICYSNSFYYDFINDIISYSFDEDEDEIFLSVCKECNSKIIQCDDFILSLLHELGHHALRNNYSLDDWIEYNEYVDNFDAENLSKEDLLKYYHSKMEYPATKWACDFIVNNKDKVNELINKLKIISPSFYQWKELIVKD